MKRLLSASVALLMLTACETSPPASQEPARAVPQPEGTGPRMVRRQGPVPPLAELRGATPGRLVKLLGEPSLRRREGGMEMWNYAAPECVLFFFLYPAEGKGLRVTHLEASPGGVTEAALSACVRAAASRPVPVS